MRVFNTKKITKIKPVMKLWQEIVALPLQIKRDYFSV